MRVDKEVNPQLKKGKKLDPAIVTKMAEGHRGLTHTKEYKMRMKSISKTYRRDAFGRFVRG